MSLPTFETARDECQGLFATSWAALSPAAVGGSAPRIEWQGVDALSPPPANLAFARHFVRHGPSRQTTFGTSGNRRFTRVGLVTVQVYTPLANGGGLSLCEKLGIIARNTYEGVGTASGLWFRNVRLQEVGPSGPHYQFSLTAEFQYDEQR